MSAIAQEKFTLEAAGRVLRRKKTGALRRQGIIPGVVHGKDVEPIHVQVDGHDFERLYHKAHKTAIVTLKIDGRDTDVLIHGVHWDKITGKPIHIEFLKVDPKRLVTVEAPLTFVGASPAEKEGRGKITHEETSIHLRCTPDRIPQEIVVDVSTIKDKHDVIHAGDLALPEGVQLAPGVNEKKVIASLVTTRALEEAPAEAAEAATPSEGAEAAGQEG
jgi:large subunit ribosomal protein L25